MTAALAGPSRRRGGRATAGPLDTTQVSRSAQQRAPSAGVSRARTRRASSARESQSRASPTRRGPSVGRIRSLDGLRGLAVLAVVLYHFAPGVAPGGFLGVDVFFVLSGFLITSLLVSEWEHAARISLPRFWARRARRLLPALLLLLTACAIWALAVAPEVQGQHVATDGLAALSYIANWRFIASSQSYLAQFANRAPTPLQHTWSLAIEEQFYFVWPLLVAAVGALTLGRTGRSRRRRRLFRRSLVSVCLVLATISFFRMFSLYTPGADPSRVYFGTDTHAAVILFGAVVGVLAAGAPIVRRPYRGMLLALGIVSALGLGTLFATASVASPWLYEGGYALVGLAILCVLVAAAQPGFNPLRKLLETRALVGLGLISYGVYLWHWPMFIWLTRTSVGVDGPLLFVARSAATLAVAIPSYFLVELPIRERRMPRLSSPVPGLIPLAVVTAVASLLILPSMAFPSVATAPTTAVKTHASQVASLTYERAPRCDAKPDPPINLGTPPQPFRVQLVGNSFAGEIEPCLGAILRARGGQLESLVAAGDDLCYRRQYIRAQLQNPSTRPAVAVLFQYPFPDRRLAPCSDTQSWGEHLTEAISEWRDAGVHVVLVPDVALVGSRGPLDQTTSAYEAAALSDPEGVSIVDTGLFIRDGNGRSQWRMPCVPREVGCGADGTIAVRWPGDRMHFCSDPDWIAHNQQCASQFAGGERRVTAVVAAAVISAGIRRQPQPQRQ